jgi:nucleoside-diphosphate-sugar epimerase
MRILVTGVDGYIGSLLGPYLLQRGMDVIGLDTGFYRQGWLYPAQAMHPLTITKDLRRVAAEDLVNIDAIAHLAELSNDPLAQQNPSLTYEINYKATVRLAQLARSAGVKRFVYMSSCSVYGVGKSEQILDETSPVNPQTAYAECKVRVENDLAALAGDRFSVCSLRNATAYGASPRQRFDIVLNDLCGLAWTTREITLLSDGSPWRPLVHALDICQAVHLSLTAPAPKINAQIYNVGSSDQNYRVLEIAQIVAQEFTGCKINIGKTSTDNRSYRVNFDKIASVLPEFACKWNAKSGARQMHELFSKIRMTPEVFRAAPYTRLKMLQHYRDTGQLDDKLFWCLE